MQWPPRPGPGHEAEGLGRRGADHLVHVDSHAVADDLHLVREPDVDRAMHVLQELHHLGGARRAHRDHLVDRRGVEREADLHARRRDAAQDLRDRVRRETGVAGILALRRVREKDRGLGFSIKALP